MTLNNEYKKLLQYLESHEKDLKVQKSEKIKQQVSEETKKIIEECQEKMFSDIPQQISISTNGFDVEKFESLMRSKLIDEHKKLQSYERPWISVSELYTCLRKNYYYRLKYPVDVKAQYRFSYLHLINSVGNAVHEVVQSLYDFSEVEKTIVSEKFGVKGRIDALRKKYLYEIKTIDAEKFKNKYIAEHYYQALCYAYILNVEYDYEIENITLVYILRNLKRIVPFDLPFNSDLAESYLSNALILKDHLERKQVVDPINATIEQCNYCSYRKYCEKDPCKINQPFVKKEKKEQSKKDVVFLM